MLKTLNIKKILLYCYAFFIIYTPNFFARYGLDVTIILIAISIIQLYVFLLNKGNLIKLMTKSGIVFCVSIFVISIYFMIIALLNGIEITNLKGLRIVQNNMPIIYFINIAFLISYLRNMNYSRDEMYKFLFNVTLIQAVICIVMFFNSDFRQIALDLYYFNKEENIWITSKRIYGITNDYTYGTQIFHGIIGIVISIYAILKDKKYFLYMPFILFAIVLNGRTGLLIYLVVMFIVLMYYAIYTKKMLKALKYIVVIIIVIFAMMIILKNLAPAIYEFCTSLVKETKNLFSDNSLEGNYAALFDRMLFFPEGINFIFGRGFKVYAKQGYEFGVYESSDIGYVNDMFMGGIVFCIFLYYTYMKFILKRDSSYKNDVNRYLEKLISMGCILSIVIANYKGEAFRSSVILSGIIIVKMITLNCNREGEKDV